ncbi:suppressor of fused domain protein [Amycolatopsis sp. OK19-0408]|uniref:Suppressor of fused domain protein n=1 Tax=Amycolatopsis iheyensis TaxID=2945988 RepID=A0A9X2SQG1_9PSEU|nr:suppressor of fused domain protein [Amycolatopsis iheyensis]MCR6488620.1 suppressor of fused domain protein [Amycolatopsis iheyensis]
MGLIEHLEARLGALTGGWKRDGFQVGAFEGAFGAKWFATVGLSRHPLHSRASGRHLWLELIVGSYPSGPVNGLPHLLGQVADELLVSGQALLRGDVLGPRGPFAPGSAMEALYAAIPVYFDDEFAAADVDDGNRAAIVWLTPISAGEAAYVASHGWNAFEDELIKHDPDLLDLGRAELPLR